MTKRIEEIKKRKKKTAKRAENFLKEHPGIGYTISEIEKELDSDVNLRNVNILLNTRIKKEKDVNGQPYYYYPSIKNVE